MRVEGTSAIHLPHSSCKFPSRSRTTPVAATIVIVPSNIYFFAYLPPANEVWGKVKCLQACVCPQGRVPDRYLPGPGTPPWSRHTPPRPGTPPRRRHPLGGDTPWEQTPPGSRHSPPRADTPPQCRACWEIRSTGGRYESYWNAILFITCKQKNSSGAMQFQLQ